MPNSMFGTKSYSQGQSQQTNPFLWGHFDQPASTHQAWSGRNYLGQRAGQAEQPAILSARLEERGQVFPAGHSLPAIQLNCIVVLEIYPKSRS